MNLSIRSFGFFLVFLFAAASAQASCDEASKVCVCSGSCPSFTNGWSSSTQSINGVSLCVAAGGDGVTTSVDNGSVTINGQAYNPPFDSCPGDSSSSSASAAAGSFQVAAAASFVLALLF